MISPDMYSSNTQKAITYPIKERNDASIIDLPAIDENCRDVRSFVRYTINHLANCFIIIADAQYGYITIDDSEIEQLILDKECPLLICFNKADKLVDELRQEGIKRRLTREECNSLMDESELTEIRERLIQKKDYYTWILHERISEDKLTDRGKKYYDMLQERISEGKAEIWLTCFVTDHRCWTNPQNLEQLGIKTPEDVKKWTYQRLSRN